MGNLTTAVFTLADLRQVHNCYNAKKFYWYKEVYLGQNKIGIFWARSFVPPRRFIIQNILILINFKKLINNNFFQIYQNCFAQ